MSIIKTDFSEPICEQGLLTPYTFSVALLIRDYHGAKTTMYDILEPMTVDCRFRTVISLPTAKQEYMMSTLIMHLINGPQVTFKELCDTLIHMWNEMCPAMWISYLLRFQHILNGGDDTMHELNSTTVFATNYTARDPPPGRFLIRSSSPVGLFLRRIALALECMDYPEQLNFDEKLREYLGDSESWINATLDQLAPPLQRHWSKILYPTCKDHTSLEDFVQYTDIRLCDAEHVDWHASGVAYLIDRQGPLIMNNDEKASDPDVLRQNLDEIEIILPEVPRMKLFDFLMEAKAGDRNVAREKLHETNDDVAAGIFTPGEGKAEIYARGIYRYSALAGASHFFRFGYKEEALAEVMECVTEGRRAMDVPCLQLAAVRLWDHNEIVSAERSEEIIVKLLKLSMSQDAVDRMLAFVSSGTLKLHPPWMNLQIVNEAELICTHDGVMGRLLMAQQCRAGLWMMVGKDGMSQVVESMILNCETYNPYSMIECRLDATPLMAVSKAERLSHSGHPHLALKILDWLGENFEAKLSGCPDPSNMWPWRAVRAMVLSKAYMRQGKLESAGRLARSAAALKPLHSAYLDAEATMLAGRLDLALRKVCLVIERASQLVKAKEPSSRLSLVECAHLLTKALLLKCLVRCQAGCPNEAVFDLIEAMAIARNNHLFFLMVQCFMHLANIQDLLGMKLRSLQVLRELEVVIYTNYDSELVGRLDLLRAKILSRKILAEEEPRRRDMEACRDALTRAAERFAELGDMIRERNARLMKGAMLCLLEGEKGCVGARREFRRAKKLTGPFSYVSYDLLF